MREAKRDTSMPLYYWGSVLNSNSVWKGEVETQVPLSMLTKNGKYGQIKLGLKI